VNVTAEPVQRIQPLHRWLLGALISAVLVSNLVWLHVDQRPTDMDQGRYMMMVHGYADGWGSLNGDFIESLWRGNHPTHPHLVPLLASVPFVLSGRNVDAAYTVNTIFFIALLVLLFLFGRQQHDSATGLLAAALAAGFPMLSRFSRFFLLEEAATFFVVATLLALLKCRYFSHLGWSLTVGAAIGFGLLTKWTTASFTAPPILLVLAVALYKERRLTPLWRAAAAGVIALMIAAPWYITHQRQLADFVSYAEKGLLFAGDGPGWHQLWYYLRSFSINAGWPYTLLASLGLIHLVWRRDVEHRAVLLGILVPLIVFSFVISTRDVRHLLPAFPFLILGGAAAIRSVAGHRWLRGALTTAAAILALVSTYHSAWGFGEGDAPVHFISQSTPLLPEARAPDRRTWGFAELLQSVDDDARGDDRPTVVRILPGNLPFRANAFVFLAAERFPAMRIVQVPFYIPSERSGHLHFGARDLLDGAYLLLREGDINGNSTGLFQYARALHTYLDRSSSAEDLFRVVETQVLPSGHQASVLHAEQLNRCDAAIADFLDWAYETDSDDPGIREIVSHCAAHRGGFWSPLSSLFSPAEGELTSSTPVRSFVAEYPDVRLGQRLLADALRAEGELAAAARIYEALAPQAPDLCSPWLAAAECWLRVGQLPSARRDLELATSATPDCMEAHRQLSSVLLGLGQTEAAQLQERKRELLLHQEDLAARVDTARFRLLLGDLAHAAGQDAEARYHYRAGLRNEPDHRELHSRLRSVGATSATDYNQ
jgi:tetratricopeptide (TPR) repeat protein